MSKHQLPLTPADRDQLLHAVELRQHNWVAHEPYLDAIRQTLSQGALLPPDQWSGLTVIGSTVTCSAHDDPDQLHHWTLVLPGEEDENSNRISVLNPLGWELLGARVGEMVEQTAFEDEVGKFLVEQISRSPHSASPATAADSPPR